MIIVHCKIFVDTFMKWAGNGRNAQMGIAMGRTCIVESELPTFCSHVRCADTG
jgi:hypothetical protein